MNSSAICTQKACQGYCIKELIMMIYRARNPELQEQYYKVMYIYSQLYHEQDPPFTPFLEDLSNQPASLHPSHHSMCFLTQNQDSPLAPLKLEDTCNIWGIIEEPLQLDVPQEQKKAFFDAEEMLQIARIAHAREEQEKMLESYLFRKKQVPIESSKVQSASFAAAWSSFPKTKKIKKGKAILLRE